MSNVEITGSLPWLASIVSVEGSRIEDFDPDPVDESGECRIVFETIAVFQTNPPVVPPPPTVIDDSAGTVYLRQVNQVYPAPSLLNGVPQNWAPTSTTVADWGRLRVLIGGVDMTFFRGVPCLVENLTISDPFGDRTATLTFPQITPFDQIKSIIPEYAEIRIERVHPDEVTTSPLWDGFVVGYDASSGMGATIECAGSFYYFDLRVTLPLYAKIIDDAAHFIRDSANLLIAVSGANLTPVNSIETGYVFAQGSIGKSIVTEEWRSYLTAARTDLNNLWTMTCHDRTPIITKNHPTAVHYQVRVGQPGVEAELSQDLIVANSILGEGIDDDGCFWRNSRYPGFSDSPPEFPGITITVGATDGTTNGGVSTWQARMRSVGYPVTMTGTYTEHDAEQTRQFQRIAGVGINGMVGPVTWNAAFQPGMNTNAMDAAFILPLWSLPAVEFVTRSADGSITGLNPAFDPSIPMINQYINFGQGVPRVAAINSARRMVFDEWEVGEKGWVGRITLKVDPESGSRWSIRAGQNIRLRGFQNQDMLFHIGDVTMDFESQSVTLTVDSKFRDILEIHEVIERNKLAKEDFASRVTIGRRQSETIEDRVAVWDCESMAGVIPRTGLFAGFWHVIRVPAAEFGEIVGTELRADHKCTLSMGVFDSPIFPSTLQNHGQPERENFWEDMPEEWGCLIGWGGEGQMGGYHPGRQSNEDDPLTGVLIDRASWYYKSRHSPWLWVALWAGEDTFVQGRLYPGPGMPGDLPRYGVQVNTGWTI